jgi:hypothetical protein
LLIKMHCFLPDLGGLPPHADWSPLKFPPYRPRTDGVKARTFPAC